MTSRVLFDHVLHIIGPQGLFELLLGYIELHYPAGTTQAFALLTHEDELLNATDTTNIL